MLTFLSFFIPAFKIKKRVEVWIRRPPCLGCLHCNNKDCLSWKLFFLNS